jgi:hypothetical protein
MAAAPTTMTTTSATAATTAAVAATIGVVSGHVHDRLGGGYIRRGGAIAQRHHHHNTVHRKILPLLKQRKPIERVNRAKASAWSYSSV